MDKVSGGDIIARMLKNEGVDTVFGIIDGSYLALNFALRRHGIRLITPRHEACAAHMAGAYARLTGRLGVCLASSGPGVANVLPGVVVEQAEGNRVLLITSSRRVGISNPDRGGTYQYFDQVGVITPTAKWSGSVPSFARIPEFMKRAFRWSFKGRPGVVHVDIPESIINGKDALPPLPSPETYRRTVPIQPDPALVDRAADLLTSAAAPLIHAGSGVIHAQAFEELRKVAELLNAPVSTSWGARAALSEESHTAVPMPYVDLLDRVRNEADVLLVVGSRLGETDWWGKAPNWAQAPKQTTIQVDNDEDILGLNKPVDVAILADAKAFLAALHDAVTLRMKQVTVCDRKERLAAYAKERSVRRAKLDEHLEDRAEPLNTAHVANVCGNEFSRDAVCILDGGNTTIWGQFFHAVREPNTLLMTAKFGMLGAGVPQALGAAAAFPERQVYCIIGDGAMGFNIQEIETAVRNRLRVVFLVCCDKQWGMVKMTQQFATHPWKTLLFKTLKPEETVNTELGEIRFDRVAEAMGAFGARVQSPAALKEAIGNALQSGTAAVIHIDVDPVKHLWAPNLMTFKKMHQEPAGR
jgi:acetolactate synthase-1/2/3 large subunit